MDGRRGWVDRDSETETTWSRSVFSWLAELECVCPRSPARRFQGGREQIWQLSCNVCSIPPWLSFFPPGGLLLERRGGQNILLPSPSLDTDAVVGEGGQERLWKGWRCTRKKEGNPSKFGWMGWHRGPGGRDGRGKEGERKKEISLLL